jgi:hypothetical protein
MGPAGPDGTNNTGILRVTVNNADGTPMTNFEVILEMIGVVGQTATGRDSSGAGYYLFENLVPGDYRVTVNAAGCASASKTTTVLGQTEIEVPFTMEAGLFGVTTPTQNPLWDTPPAGECSSFYSINPDTGVPTLIGQVTGYDVYAMAVNPVDKKFYAIGYNTSFDNQEQAAGATRQTTPWTLLTINPLTGEPTVVGEISNTVDGPMPYDCWAKDIAFNSAGTCYCYAYENGEEDDEEYIRTIDITTGTSSARMGGPANWVVPDPDDPDDPPYLAEPGVNCMTFTPVELTIEGDVYPAGTLMHVFHDLGGYIDLNSSSPYYGQHVLDGDLDTPGELNAVDFRPGTATAYCVVTQVFNNFACYLAVWTTESYQAGTMVGQTIDHIVAIAWGR